MANSDVLDILSETIPSTNRGTANKDEIIREKVIFYFPQKDNYLIIFLH